MMGRMEILIKVKKKNNRIPDWWMGQIDECPFMIVHTLKDGMSLTLENQTDSARMEGQLGFFLLQQGFSPTLNRFQTH